MTKNFISCAEDLSSQSCSTGERSTMSLEQLTKQAMKETLELTKRREAIAQNDLAK